jgi:hypothetical protein
MIPVYKLRCPVGSQKRRNCVYCFQNSTNVWCNKLEEEKLAKLLFTFVQKERVNSWRTSLKLIAADDAVKMNVLVFRVSFFFFCGIQRCLFNDQAYDKLSDSED